MTTMPKISDAEWLVMKAVWKQPGCSAQQLIESLAATTDWGPATIKTLLNRLLKKKALHFEPVGKAYLYYPSVAEADLKAAEADSFLARIFDGNFSPMLSHFVESKQLSESELEELRKILRKGEKKR